MHNLHLLTRDRPLIDVCRDVVRKQFRQSVRLMEQNGSGSPERGDLLFIDLSSFNLADLDLSSYEPETTGLFVAREELSGLADRIFRLRFHLVLKPASAARVEMVIRQFLKHSGAEPASSEPARTDALFQSVLESNVHLQLYDQDRNHFVARAMHDFRTPLTALDGYTGLLLHHQLGEISPAQAVVLERMRHSIRRLTYLADGVMNLSLGQSALRPLKLKSGSIEKCVEQAAAQLSAAFAERSITLRMDISPPPCALQFEPVQIEQVIANLLDHAQKFSPRFGAVSVRAYPYFWDRRIELLPLAEGISERRRAPQNGNNSYRIDVSDSGPRLSEESRAAMFTEQSSAADEGAQDGGGRSGAGLALAICKLILDRHRGAIWASAREKGAMLSLVLPSAFSCAENTGSVDQHVAGLARAAAARSSSTSV